MADLLGLPLNLVEQIKLRQRQRIGRPPVSAEDLVAEIRVVAASLPTYGYRRMHALLLRRALAEGYPPPNHSQPSEDHMV